MTSLRLRPVISGLIVLLFVATAHSADFPGSVWESSDIQGAVMSAVAADIDRNGRTDVVYTLPKAIVVTGFNQAGELARVTAGEGEEFHRLHAGDFNSNGELEILANGFARAGAFTRLFAWRGGTLAAVQEFTGTVMPLNFGGQTALWRQSTTGRARWAQRLEKLKWENGRYVATDAGWDIAKGIGGNTTSLFALAGMGDWLITMKDDGRLLVRDVRGKGIWKSGLRYGGAVDRIKVPDRDPLGIKLDTMMILLPRMSTDTSGANIVVPKNSGFLPQAIGAFPNLKAATYSVLTWTGSGMREKFTSPRYDGAISDVQIIDYNGDGAVHEILLTLWSRKGGVLDTSQPKVSVLAVAPLP